MRNSLFTHSNLNLNTVSPKTVAIISGLIGLSIIGAYITALVVLDIPKYALYYSLPVFLLFSLSLIVRALKTICPCRDEPVVIRRDVYVEQQPPAYNIAVDLSEGKDEENSPETLPAYSEHRFELPKYSKRIS